MTHNPSKPKLLLDENFEPRKHLPKLNQLYDVKHIVKDLHISGLADPDVYALAAKLNRLVVTYNEKDFLPLARTSQQSGVIAVSANLTPTQIDTKLISLLRRRSLRQLYGAFHYISGESHP
jgi:predicted nuclease of predicted toxin-antitoxin system